ncbi:MAG: sigma 54-interacting transcriptional regulator [Deltaproteobacteria bacterium]|nr:sigma 54-interacting transcriptional regulator [Deltaproteobacteria bacterium]
MESEITAQDVVHFTSNGAIVTDSDGIVVLINSRAAQLVGLNSASIIGTHIRSILRSAGDRVMRCIDTSQAELGYSESSENGHLIVNITPITARHGRPKGTVVNFQPMKELKKTAAKISSYKLIAKHLSTIFEASSDGIWVTDATGRIIALNRASERLNGIKSEEVLGQNVSIMLKNDLVDQNITPEVIRTRQSLSIMQYIKRTGRYLLVTGTPAFDEDGNLLLVVVNERDMTQLNWLQKKLEEVQMEAEKMKSELAELSLQRLQDQNIVAESEAMRQVYNIATRLSKAEASNILILGESGTGKGMLSQFIHQNSPRAKSPFITINCAALPESLLEAELFGYEKGAFTGAKEHGKVGLFELANEGTLFLDEIGDIPLAIQAKLLKYLDDYEIMRLGGTKSRKIDCLLVAATNQDLGILVKNKQFRQDLFHRLNTFTIKISPLRERQEDIFALTHNYLASFNRKYKKKNVIRAEGMTALQNYPFPGNVRELVNILREAVVMCDNRAIDQFIIAKLRNAQAEQPGTEESPSINMPFSLEDRLNALEKRLLMKAAKNCGTTLELAQAMKISQATAFRKLKKHAIILGE